MNKIAGLGAFGGTHAQAAVNGCATFTGLTLGTSETYQIRATDSTLSDTSWNIFVHEVCGFCPSMTAALVDACGGSEGRNEILFYNSGQYMVPADPRYLDLSYGASSPPATHYTDTLVSNQAYVDSLNARAGCALFIDAFTNQPIPPFTDFLIMNEDPLEIYDFQCALRNRSDLHDFLF